MRKTICNLILNLFFLLLTISFYSQQASEENNAITSKQIEQNNERLEILRTEDSLSKVLIEKSGDINSATNTSAKSSVLNDKYGKLGNPDLNQDMSQQPQAEDADEVNRSTLSKLIDSIPPVISYIFWGALAVITIKFLFGKKE